MLCVVITNKDLSMKKIITDWFAHKKITENLYLIYEPCYYERSRVNIWVINGKDSILVIDTGLGLSSLIKYIKKNIDSSKPIKAVATDIHFDHTGGMHEFEDCSIHVSEMEPLATGDQSHILSTPEYGFVSDSEFTKYPFAGFSVEKYCVQAAPQVKPLKDSDEISLGDIVLEAIHLPGHSEGALALYDKKNKNLFCGDIVYDGNLLDDLPGSNIDDYVKSMSKLLSLDPANVYPGHFQPFDKSKMYSIAKNYIDRKLKKYE